MGADSGIAGRDAGYTEFIAAELRASGGSRTRSSGRPTTLTAEERRIADLAADGKTNKVFLSSINLSSTPPGGLELGGGEPGGLEFG